MLPSHIDPKIYFKTWREENREKVTAYRKQYYLVNKEREKSQMKAYRARANRDPEKVKVYRQTARARDLLRKYSLSQEDYDKMYLKQQGKCLMCDKYFKVLCVDHSHATGKVRGLLCKTCNLVVGIVEYYASKVDKYLELTRNNLVANK